MCIRDRPYGLERVCRALEFPRSTIYAQQARESANVLALRPQRRGPKPKMADADLLVAIRADLDASPFTGEGHRKVWARLRILRAIRVSRARVLRLMRESSLLSPHRRLQGDLNLHDGSIGTERPNDMWGTCLLYTSGRKRWCCGCCAASQWMSFRGRSRCRYTSWSSGVIGR